MSVNLVQGKPQEFVATISFNLNLENKKSAKVLKGDMISYDGHMVSFTPANGVSITGESKSLLSAIGNWLMPKNGTKPPKTEEPSANVPSATGSATGSNKDFDDKKGGNFDTYVQKNAGEFAVAGQTGNVIREKDLIVGKVSSTKPEEVTKKSEAKREVAGDQVDVKKVGSAPLTVGSTTAVPRTKAHSTKIEASDAYGADGSQPRGSKKEAEQPKKKKTFTVDATTPAVNEDPTLSEVRNAKRAIPDEEQDGQVVGKTTRQAPQVQQMDGITLKRRESPKDMTITTKVSSGGEPAVDIATSKDAVVVKTASELPAEEKKLTSKEYMDMLPKDWDDMHWVKKEKWIKSQTSKGLLEYLISVEKINAIVNACKERLKELA